MSPPEPISRTPFLSRHSEAVLIFLGFGFIITSLLQISALMDYEHYRYLFQQYSEVAIRSRFITSWISRLAGLVIGFGLLTHKEIFRKAALILAGGTALLAYWKHPFEGFVRHIHWLNDQMAAAGIPISPNIGIELVQNSYPDFTEEAFVTVCVMTIVLWEIFCASVVLFLLTRPSVKNRYH